MKISQKNCKSYQYIKKKSSFAVGIIVPYFFNDAANRKVTVDGERHREMLSNLFLPKIQEIDLHDIQFQQDGVTYHTARIIKASSVNILFHVRDRSIGRVDRAI